MACKACIIHPTLRCFRSHIFKTSKETHVSKKQKKKHFLNEEHHYGAKPRRQICTEKWQAIYCYCQVARYWFNTESVHKGNKDNS